MSHSQVNIFIIFITFYLKNFNGNVAIMMKMWDIATSNQGGRGLASFVGTMNFSKVHESGTFANILSSINELEGVIITN